MLNRCGVPYKLIPKKYIKDEVLNFPEHLETVENSQRCVQMSITRSATDFRPARSAYGSATSGFDASGVHKSSLVREHPGVGWGSL